MTGFARTLVQEGLLSHDQAQSIVDSASVKGVPFVTELVENIRALDALTVAVAGAEGFGLPLLDIAAMDIDGETAGLVEEKLIRKHNALPLFKRGKRLFVAVSDPTNFQGLDEIKFHAGCSVEPVLVEQDKLSLAIDQVMEAQDTSLSDLADADLDDLEISGGDELPEDDGGDSDVDDAPIVRFINKLLLDAINGGASDIHFEPYEKSYRVRYREDGVLHEVATPPPALANRLAARVKVMARLDISERRLPQDGRIKMTLSKNRAIDFRVNTCPTLFGEKIVLRILDPTSAQLGVDALGFEPEQKEALLAAVHQPYGMVLVTGPTGSGKTVSLYTCLNILNTPDRNISTAEDPAEINLPGINQVNVNPKVGLTFASALRAFLRQDPDVIMVGEIRDLETAEIAIKAAQTGHMVFSTLHTNDAPQTLTRLANMGVAPFNIASSVSLIVAQRLARRLCPHCKAPHEIPAEALIEEGFAEEEVNGLTVFRAVGCDHCSDGYKGRVGVYQVMPISEDMGRLIMENCNAMALADMARQEGVADLRTSGLNKVRAGLTSLEEINRVITV
ncbi:MAG TPA: type IV-A pilus assembly ATPase PilB [Gammaproteobacteria bacterium]|nr:type IV-A pilus assembly ATPase PilB [Gammaproteobacteria bacterium]